MGTVTDHDHPIGTAKSQSPSLAGPAVATELEAIARSSNSCVVQPHLLFHGKLTSDLQAMVRSKQAGRPAKKWLVADHLNPCDLVAEAAVSRFWEARAVVD